MLILAHREVAMINNFVPNLIYVKELNKENDAQGAGKEVSTEAINKAQSDEEKPIQESKNAETKAKDSPVIEKKVKAETEDGKNDKNSVNEKSQDKAPQVLNDEDNEQNKTEKTELKLNQDKTNSDSELEPSNEPEEDKKT